MLSDLIIMQLSGVEASDVAEEGSRCTLLPDPVTNPYPIGRRYWQDAEREGRSTRRSTYRN